MREEKPPRRRLRLLAWGAGVCLLGVLGLFYFRQTMAARPYRRTDYLFGTFVEVTAYGPRARAGVTAAFTAMQAVAEKADPTRPTSDLARLNRAAGKSPVRINPTTMHLLRLAKEWYIRTDGAFDVTVGPLVSLWGFDPNGRPHLPTPAAVVAARKALGSDDLLLDEKHQTAFLRRPGMAVDLGGLAKGYAVDRAFEALRKLGIRAALINAGGSSIRALGRPPQRDAWRIAIAHPRKEGEFLRFLSLGPGEALGTSADNQRFFFAGGRRYHHLFDPSTGYPATGTVLCSVVAKDAVTADILSTACFVKGPAAGFLLARAQGAAALFYTPEGRTMTTPEFGHPGKKS
ncbi:MAG: FAD:protein FMN transferase [Firmicutes bacterium]|nr:FAD:protein FMN transferase [Bacillota bacterium]